MRFREKQRVVTPGGTGMVIAVQMMDPERGLLGSVSVLLDAKRDRFGYRGTIYSASDVRPLVN